VKSYSGTPYQKRYVCPSDSYPQPAHFWTAH